jgi:hypothetical protein
MIARKTLLMPNNAGIAVSFERRFSASLSLRHFPNIRRRPNIGSAQNASNGCCILQPHGETFLMRSKLAISALVVASLFGSTLIASAQNQTAPGASSAGTVSPGATDGKIAQHEKGMTTGSSTRSGGAEKGGVPNPSDQDDAGSGAGTMAPPPMSGSKY